MKNNIKVERARADMTQQELADALKVSRQTIYAIETGRFNPSTILSLRMARLFNTTVENIFYLEDSDE